MMAMRAADVLDVLLVAGLIFALLYFLRGTRAVQLLRGLLILFLLITLFSRVVRLPTFSTIVGWLITMFVVAIPVVFQPELRRMMERLGRAGRISSIPNASAASTAIVPVVVLAARRLSEARHGGLIVMERVASLADVTERGVKLDAEASVDLLTQVFVPNTPLHDGAVIVRDGRIVAARVVLPLRDAPLRGDPGLGTRHLAAVAVTEETDALAVVVSEETGAISLAESGSLQRHLDEATLSRLLYTAFVAAPSPAERFIAPFARLASLERLPTRGSGSEGGASAGRTGASS
jgi:diadenylate cyclase